MQLIYKNKRIFLLGLSFFLFVGIASAAITGSGSDFDTIFGSSDFSNSLIDSNEDLGITNTNLGNYGVGENNSEIYQDIESGIAEDTDSYIDSLSFDNLDFYIGFTDNCSTLSCHIGNLIAIVKGLIMIVIGMSVLAFLWGLVKYVKSVDDKTRQEAIGTITYGVLALFVMVSVWGLVNLLTTSFDFNTGSLENKNINPTNLIKKN